MRLEGTEGVDFVVCQECGYKATKLYRHLAKHSMNLQVYKSKYPNAEIRCSLLKDKQRISHTLKHLGHLPKGNTKTVQCTVCQCVLEVNRFAGSLHDLRCIACKTKTIPEELDKVWQDKVEGVDYVVCLECGFRANNLSNHVLMSHPQYRDMYPDSPIVAQQSMLRDNPLLGTKLSEETRLRMSQNAGRWNAGLTKEVNPSLAIQAMKMRARPKLVSLGDLESCLDGNGKVILGQVAASVGCSKSTVSHSVKRHGLLVSGGNISELLCLATVAKALDGATYQREWSHAKIINPRTGRRFKFDGYFSEHRLLVEFNGYQHYTFPNRFMPDESYRLVWEQLLWRDRQKVEMAERDGYPVLVIRADEPYRDVAYITTKLKAFIPSITLHAVGDFHNA